MKRLNQFKSNLLPDCMKWPDYLRLAVLALSVDAFFLWTVSYALTKGTFELIDTTFLFQLQSRIVGILVVSWFLASLIAVCIRVVFTDIRVGVLRKLRVRRLQRLVLSKGRLEIFLSVLFFAILSLPFMLVVLLLLCLAVCSAIVHAIVTRIEPEFSRRIKRRDPNHMRDYQRVKGILDRQEKRLDAAIGLLPFLLLLVSIFATAGGFVENLKNAATMTLDLGAGEIDAVIVGQTRYGFLIWNVDQCDCLSAVLFSAVEQVRP